MRCPEVWTGTPRRYQERAADALAVEGREVPPYAWITPRCGNPTCITPDHLAIQAPVRLAYPHGVCIYCGRHAGTRDHLLPRNWSGDTRRRYVVTVPACGTCNTLLRDTLTWSITERRAICHARLRKHFRKVLRVIDRTPEELAEYGRNLREHIRDGMERKAEVLRMLDWPEDPAYDARALERSGLADPYSVGLLLPDDADLDEYVREVA